MLQSRVGSPLTIPSTLASLIPFQDFLPSLLSYLTAWRWSAVESSLTPVTALINSMLVRYKLRNLSSADVTGFCRSRLDFLTGIVIKFPMIGGREFYSLKKRWGKKVPRRSLSTHTNAYPVFFCHTLQKYPYRLDHTYYHSVNLLRICLRRFADRVNVIFPLQHTM